VGCDSPGLMASRVTTGQSITRAAVQLVRMWPMSLINVSHKAPSAVSKDQKSLQTGLVFMGCFKYASASSPNLALPPNQSL
jgi:hypothetical protein